MSRSISALIFNVQYKACMMKMGGIDKLFSGLSVYKKFDRLVLGLLACVAYTNVYATNTPVDMESSVENDDSAAVSTQDSFQNNVGVLSNQEQIKFLRDSYISPYNYLQDPIALDMGYDTREAESTGTFHAGTSVIAGQNRPIGQSNMTFNTDVAQIWGQTGRWDGFALGGGAVGVFNVNNSGHVNSYTTTGQLAPVQAYVNYQYSNKVDVTAGNILISTPWVSSFGSAQGGTYAMGNNTYQGALINVQALPSLLITGYTAVGYLQYPNSWYGPQTYYNTMGGPLSNAQPTSGTSGVGMVWNPVDSYTGQLWFYNFADYANMAYIDNAYHVGMSKLVSMDFGFQAFTQSSAGSAITNQVSLPGQTTPAGYVSSNGLGLKMALNIGNNTSSISFNNIFGRNGSFLNGGMVTPYSYGMEVDPLYTTPALTSLAELGSGYAYTLRNSTAFLEKTLKFNLSMSQFFVNQSYASQVTQVTEYDTSLLYNIPHTTMNIWSRLVYLQQPANLGGDMWQPRVIFNWTY